MTNNNDIKFANVFNLEKQLFNSLSWTYEGLPGFGTGWVLNSQPDNYSFDLFELNGDKNMYYKFLEKEFYQILENIFNSKSLARQFYPNIYLEESNEGEMNLCFSPFNIFGSLYLSSLITDTGSKFDDLVKSFNSIEEMFDCLKKALKEERKYLKETNEIELKKNEKVLLGYNNTYNEIKNLYGRNISFEEFIQNRIDTITKIITSIKFLVPFLEKKIDIKQLYSIVDYEKLCLILAYDFMKHIELIEKRDGRINSCVIYLEKYIKTIEYLEETSGSKYFCSIDVGNGKKYNVDLLKQEYLTMLDKHPEVYFREVDYEKLKKAFNKKLSDEKIANKVSKMSKKEFSNFVNDIILHIDEFINQANTYGAKNVTSDEMITTIKEIKNEIENGNLSLEEYKNKKHQLDKLNMVFNEIKPKAIQKGIGPFKNFNVYYYNNGMVAIDKIEYGARLFIMPITTYKYIVENNIESLRVIGRMDGVKAFKHDERTDWLSNAKEYIENGNMYSSIEDIKINEDIVSWEFDFSEDDIKKLDKIIEEIKYSENYTTDEKNKKINKVQELKKKKENKRKRAKEIDDELKTSVPDKNYDKDDFFEIENELESKMGSSVSFEELYDYEKKINKNIKRSVAVAKYGKDRTLDMSGMYHCELCNSEYPTEQRSRLDFHHFVPIGKGGPDTIYNGLCLCTECHRIIHYEQERISTKTKIEILGKIEKHIKEENPELLEEFYEYRKSFFPTINDIIYEKRIEIKQQLLDEGISTEEYGDELVSDEIDKRIESFERQLEKEYQSNSQKYDENFEIDWNSMKGIRR